MLIERHDGNQSVSQGAETLLLLLFQGVGPDYYPVECVQVGTEVREL